MILRLVLSAALLLLAACEEKQDPRNDTFPVKPDAAFVSEIALTAREALGIEVELGEEFRAGVEDIPEAHGEFTATDEQLMAFARRGIISAYADWCGFDAQNRSFLPFMIRQRGAFDNYNANYVTLVHTLTQQRYRQKLAEEGMCPPSMKASIQRHIYDGPLADLPPENSTEQFPPSP